ncbi:mannosylglucosyl-3-phosphoglycerate phosphatase isoform X2 [Condylostylus longicornis]|uniref:mannosylglucosyl-3-phosphoglycerate phosphatase isoform X2 n=1 Tax=Condylostylus longicornis TaxID=2530218 RepID=UPI00244DA05C|nr:mannosylglucosyl-3-phosphoglycerate phosphatase isoform X2 [Condylostylus longicornis]
MARYPSKSNSTFKTEWDNIVENSSDAINEATDVGQQGLKSVVGWLKQASIEVREAGKRAVTQLQSTNPDLLDTSDVKNLFDHNETFGSPNKLPISTLGKTKFLSNMSDIKPLTILHYNDVYNIEEISSKEPVGGAARFCTAIKSFEDLDPIVLFSGDAFFPNHGLEVLDGLVKKTNFPWLMSNVVDLETGRPLGGGKITHFLYHSQTTIGLMGLVEQEWLETLPTIDPAEVTFIDYVEAGNKLAEELRNEGCEIVIALTHMRTQNDINLAKNCPNIDIILGGHDHIFECHDINGTKIIKSGTDFRQFSKITVNKFRDENGKVKVQVDPINVTSDYEEDATLKETLSKYSEVIESKMNVVLGNFSVELDGRFSAIRTGETNLGNWICDVILSATGADVVMINSGTFRSDQIHPIGPFTMKDLINIIPMRDHMIMLEITGKCLLDALENSVSGYPKLEGRFPQVAGISFAFDPKKKPFKRIDPTLVFVADESINLSQTYKTCIKSYMYCGCDGYTMFKNATVLLDEDLAPELGMAIQNHFAAIDTRMGKGRHTKHRQSLVTLSRRHSMIQMLENLELDGPSPIRKLSFSHTSHNSKSIDSGSNSTTRPKLLRRASLDDLEQESCQLAPKMQHRITIIRDEEHYRELLLRKESALKTSVIAEEDE